MNTDLLYSSSLFAVILLTPATVPAMDSASEVPLCTTEFVKDASEVLSPDSRISALILARSASTSVRLRVMGQRSFAIISAAGLKRLTEPKTENCTISE